MAKITKAKIIITKAWNGAQILIRDETKGVGNIIRKYNCKNTDNSFGVTNARILTKIITKKMIKEKIAHQIIDKY